MFGKDHVSGNTLEQKAKHTGVEVADKPLPQVPAFNELGGNLLWKLVDHHVMSHSTSHGKSSPLTDENMVAKLTQELAPYAAIQVQVINDKAFFGRVRPVDSSNADRFEIKINIESGHTKDIEEKNKACLKLLNSYYEAQGKDFFEKEHLFKGYQVFLETLFNVLDATLKPKTDAPIGTNSESSLQLKSVSMGMVFQAEESQSSIKKSQEQGISTSPAKLISQQEQIQNDTKKSPIPDTRTTAPTAAKEQKQASDPKIAQPASNFTKKKDLPTLQVPTNTAKPQTQNPNKPENPRQPSSTVKTLSTPASPELQILQSSKSSNSGSGKQKEDSNDTHLIRISSLPSQPTPRN